MNGNNAKLFIRLLFMTAVLLFCSVESHAIELNTYPDGNIIKNGDGGSTDGWDSVADYTAIGSKGKHGGVKPIGSSMFGAKSFDDPVRTFMAKQTIYLKGDMKKLSSDGQLYLGAYTHFYNNDDGTNGGDFGWLTIYLYKEGKYMGYYCTRRLSADTSYERWTKNYISYYSGSYKPPSGKDYFKLQGDLAGVDELQVVIEGHRERAGNSKDCDVYFDYIRASLTDYDKPYAKNIETYTKDTKTKEKIVGKNVYTIGDTIYFEVTFSEHMNVKGAKLKLNIEKENGEKAQATIDETDTTMKNENFKVKKAIYKYKIEKGDTVPGNLFVGLSGSACFNKIEDLSKKEIQSYPYYKNAFNDKYKIKLDLVPPKLTIPKATIDRLAAYNTEKELEFEKRWIEESGSSTLLYKHFTDLNEKPELEDAVEVDIDHMGMSFNIPIPVDDGLTYLALNVKDAAGNLASNEWEILTINKQDKKGPDIDINIIGPYKPSTYYSDYDIEIRITDDVSQVKEVVYTIGEDVHTYNKPVEEFSRFKLSEKTNLSGMDAKEVTLSVTAEDDNENESTKEATFLIDRKPPTISEIHYNPLGKKLDFSVEDNHNKVSSIKYSIVERGEAPYSDQSLWKNISVSGKEYTIDLKDYKHGEFQIYIVASDDIGNETAIGEYTHDFLVDKVGPKAYGELSAKPAKTVSFELTDDTMPIKECYYVFSKNGIINGIESSEWKIAKGNMVDGKYVGEIVFEQENVSDAYYAFIKSKDALGNESTHNILLNQPLIIDSKPPFISIHDNFTTIYAKEHHISFDVVDDNQIAVLQYGWSRDKDTDPTIWSDVSPVGNYTLTLDESQVKEDGTWYLHIKAEDDFGNIQQLDYERPFILDFTQPKGNIHFRDLGNKDHTFNKKEPLYLVVDKEVTPHETMKFQMIKSDQFYFPDEIVWPEEESSWLDYKPELEVDLTEFPTGPLPTRQYIYVRYRDQLGYISDMMSTSISVDYTPPEIDKVDIKKQGEYGPTKVTLMVEDGCAIINMEEDGGNEYEYNFKRNGSFDFIVMDQAGNTTTYPVSVTDIIENEKPLVLVTYSIPRHQWTKESVTATITLVGDPKWEVVGDSSYTFTESGRYWFEWRDSGDYSNNGSTEVVVNNIDKTPPTATIDLKYGKDSPFVIANLIPDESVRIINNDGKNSYVFYNTGSFTFEFEDKAGNRGTATATVGDEEIKPTEGFHVSYDKTGWTNQAVTATVTIPEGWHYEDNTLGLVYDIIFNESSDKSLNVVNNLDESLTKEIIISVNNIDTEAPEINDIYKDVTTYPAAREEISILHTDSQGFTEVVEKPDELHIGYNQEKIFHIRDEAGNIRDIVVEGIKDPTIEWQENEHLIQTKIASLQSHDEIVVLNNNGNDTYVFYENGLFTFDYRDRLGNERSITATVEDLYNRLPDTIVSYEIDGAVYTEDEFNDLESVNKPITVIIDFEFNNSGCKVINTENNRYTFEENGQFTFMYEDDGYYQGQKHVSISKIDRKPPNYSLQLSTYDATQNDIEVVIYWDENVELTTMSLPIKDYQMTEDKMQFIATENMSGSINVRDKAGNISHVPLNIQNIDRESPSGKVNYSTTLPSRKVEIELVTDEAVEMLEGTSKTYTCTENGEYFFIYEDEAGNRGETRAIIDWIDRIPPSVELVYSITELTNEPVEVSVVSKDGQKIFILNNNGGLTKIFYAPVDAYTFKVSDEAGNRVDVTANLSHIDREKPIITLIGESHVTLGDKEAYVEKGAKAIDGRDGDISGKISRTLIGDEDSKQFMVTYEVLDEAGNKAEITRHIKRDANVPVYAVINGERIDGSEYVTNKSELHIDYGGTKGETQVKWATGRENISYFKEQGQALKGGVLSLDPGWYTLYICDQERGEKQVYILINESTIGGLDE